MGDEMGVTDGPLLDPGPVLNIQKVYFENWPWRSQVVTLPFSPFNSARVDYILKSSDLHINGRFWAGAKKYYFRTRYQKTKWTYSCPQALRINVPFHFTRCFTKKNYYWIVLRYTWLKCINSFPEHSQWILWARLQPGQTDRLKSWPCWSVYGWH
jgi:hypothetical protein